MYDNNPEGIILSILTDYQKADAEKVIEKIIYKLQRSSKGESELRKSIKQLVVLSRLRNLEGEIKQKVNDMPITYDISKGFRGKKPTNSIMKEFKKEEKRKEKKADSKFQLSTLFHIEPKNLIIQIQDRKND